eukprot:TRINITY_DN90759_c0_g1_i1.p1 TRINITY_DN90759_c0_g1~~TRINITY_DN90759_c0_g1_i1.p1  ORF type:complete len:484 (-),score=97.39 TRINITY_DN90759_c0_g1_i1:32-1483(-)
MYDLINYLWRPRPRQAEDKEESLQVLISNAMSGHEVAQVKLLPTDTVSRLCDAVLEATGEDPSVSYRFLHQLRELEQHTTLKEAGIEDGDTVYLAKTPLQCVTASHDGSARLWPLQAEPSANAAKPSSGEEQRSRILRCDAAIGGVQLSPCRTKVLTLSLREGGIGQVWNFETLKPLFQLEGGAASAAFSPDGKCLVGVGADGIARIWSAETGSTEQTMLPPSSCKGAFEDALEDEEEVDMTLAVCSPCGQIIVTGAGDDAQIWSASSGKLLTTLQGHVSTVKAVAVTKCGKLVLTASMDATARLWCSRTGKCLQVLRGHKKPLISCSLSPNQLQALTYARDGTVKVWQLGTTCDEASCCSTQAEAVEHLLTASDGTAECLFTLNAEGSVVNDVRFSPDGSRLLVAESEKVKLFGNELGDLQLTLEGVHEDWVRSATFSPDGRFLATSSYDGSACIWSAKSGRCLHMLEGHEKAVSFASIVPL